MVKPVQPGCATMECPSALPRLSVVVPIHNGALWLGPTLDSIFQQSFQDFEIILIDDASDDDLSGALRPYEDARLRVLHLPANVGVAEARNCGVAQARGDYLAFCDADDLCHPDRFQRQLDFLEQHPEIGVCGTGFTCFDSEDRDVVLNPETPDAIRLALMQGNCFGTSTMMGRSSVFQQYPFNAQIDVAEDFDVWTRIAAGGIGMANLPLSLLHYRLHPQQASQTKSVRLDRVARKIRSRYCAQLLGQQLLSQQIELERISLAELQAAQHAIAAYCAAHPVPVTAFRYLLAWLYQQLPAHGWHSWWCWRRIQQSLGLRLDRNYRFNIFLLALLPSSLAGKYFDTLIKLKR